MQDTLYLLYRAVFCVVSILYLALYFWYGGVSGGVTVSVLYLLYRCCIAAVSLLYPLCCTCCTCCTSLYLLYLLCTVPHRHTIH
jgi:hypothetical protein